MFWINGEAVGELQIPTDRNLTNHDAGTIEIMGTTGQVKINSQVNAISDRGKAVHFTGSSNVGGLFGTVPVNGAYVVGERSENMPVSGTANYQGSASYSGYDDTTIKNGRSSAQVDFSQKKMNLNISVPDAQVNENFNDMAINGNRFSAGMSYDGLQIGPAQNNESRTSGYFYGDQAEALGGTFYNTKGLGTYSGEKQ